MSIALTPVISLADVLVGVVGGYHNDRDIVDNVRLVHFIENIKPSNRHDNVTDWQWPERMRIIGFFVLLIMRLISESSTMRMCSLCFGNFFRGTSFSSCSTMRLGDKGVFLIFARYIYRSARPTAVLQVSFLAVTPPMLTVILSPSKPSIEEVSIFDGFCRKNIFEFIVVCVGHYKEKLSPAENVWAYPGGSIKCFMVFAIMISALSPRLCP